MAWDATEQWPFLELPNNSLSIGDQMNPVRVAGIWLQSRLRLI